MWDTMRDYLLDTMLSEEFTRGTPPPPPTRRRKGMKEFRVGDKVRLKNNVDMEDVRDWGSSGKKGEVYTIYKLHNSRQEVYFEYGNWHKNHWLEHVPMTTKIGGEVL